ncbi:MAG: hypothetical protein HZA66_19945 [Rhodopseudomonas palustris]|uniref:Uncharacterized protein n=1 Tax=Rhodopseudomonas palustris TaxID=1076 RepID=A0A933S457_RHOPL|nr:hypothetical protein [Rhodopseudomonas palustris]
MFSLRQGGAPSRHPASLDRNHRRHYDMRTSVEECMSSADRGKLQVAAGLLALLAVTLGLRAVVAPDALAPAVATVLLAAAAGVALIGILLRDRPRSATWLDAAGLLVYAGVAVSIMIDPDQLVRLVPRSDQTE